MVCMRWLLLIVERLFSEVMDCYGALRLAMTAAFFGHQTGPARMPRGANLTCGFGQAPINELITARLADPVLRLLFVWAHYHRHQTCSTKQS